MTFNLEVKNTHKAGSWADGVVVIVIQRSRVRSPSAQEKEVPMKYACLFIGSFVEFFSAFRSLSGDNLALASHPIGWTKATMLQSRRFQNFDVLLILVKPQMMRAFFQKVPLCSSGYFELMHHEKCKSDQGLAVGYTATDAKSAQPVPAWVEESVSLVRHSSSGGATNNPQDALSKHGKVGCQNWPSSASAYSAAGGEREQHHEKWRAVKRAENL